MPRKADELHEFEYSNEYLDNAFDMSKDGT